MNITKEWYRDKKRSNALPLGTKEKVDGKRGLKFWWYSIIKLSLQPKKAQIEQ